MQTWILSQGGQIELKAYDIKCPKCGTVNHRLFLQETEGMFECEECGTTSCVIALKPLKVIPYYTRRQLAAVGRRMVANF